LPSGRDNLYDVTAHAASDANLDGEPDQTLPLDTSINSQATGRLTQCHRYAPKGTDIA